MPYFGRNKRLTVLFPAPISPISLVPRVSPNCYKETRKGIQNHNWIIFHTRHFRIVLNCAVYICALWWCKEWQTAPRWGLQPRSWRASNPNKNQLSGYSPWMRTHLVMLSLRYFSLSLRAVLLVVSVEFPTFWRWARGGATYGWWRELIPPTLPVEECSSLIGMFRSWTCTRVVWGCTNPDLTGQLESFTSPSLNDTVAAVGLLSGSWDQQSSMRLHNLSSIPLSILGLAGRLADFTTFLRNNDQQLIFLKGGSPENIWGSASMESFSGPSNYCEPHRSSSQSCRHQKLH